MFPLFNRAVVTEVLAAGYWNKDSLKIFGYTYSDWKALIVAKGSDILQMSMDQLGTAVRGLLAQDDSDVTAVTMGFAVGALLALYMA